jgi:hypothetical protein
VAAFVVRHDVELVYHPPGLRAGTLLSLLGAISSGVWWRADCSRERALVAVSLAIVFATKFSATRSTSFNGYDEWLVVSLTSQKIVSFPYANRPLALVWALPKTLGLPSTLDAYLLVHGAWLLLSGVAVLAVWPPRARRRGSPCSRRPSPSPGLRSTRTG